MSTPLFSVLLPSTGDSWKTLVEKLGKISGEILIVLPAKDDKLSPDHPAGWHTFLVACHQKSDRIRLAVPGRKMAKEAGGRGLDVIARTRDLKDVLADHPERDEALRAFAPRAWQQELKNRLQTMGLLSLPKVRVWILISVSTILFFFVVFRLLPSVEVRVWPYEDTVSQTANIFLVQSGATMELPQRVRRLELMPVEVIAEKTITFDQISKQFSGVNASTVMSITNTSDEVFALRGGSRLSNQAGMIFRIEEPLEIAAGEEILVRATADDLDLYGEIIGARGNVPQEITWEFPGLPLKDRTKLKVINTEEGTGGTTDYTAVLTEEDIRIGEAQLEEDLVKTAKQMIEEQKLLFNAEHKDRTMEILYYDELTKEEFLDATLPVQFLGKEIDSVPIEGKLKYTNYAYDSSAVLDMLRSELHSHVGEGRTLLEESIDINRIVAHVIDYSDDFSWIKLTVDLSGTERSVLDPLTAQGAKFAKEVRDQVVGKNIVDARRIIKNLPAVAKVEIRAWPPWTKVLPTIPSHISIVPMDDS